MLFGVERRTVTRMAADGRLIASSTPDGQYRFRPEDVQAVLSAR